MEKIMANSTIDFSKRVILWGGTGVLNCTPHELVFLGAEGAEVRVEKCGATLPATPKEAPVSTQDGATLVATVFEASEQGLAELTEIEAAVPKGTLIVGSIISAQAYPGRVVSPISAKGFERVPPLEKKMDPNKFTTFGGEKIEFESEDALTGWLKQQGLIENPEIKDPPGRFNGLLRGFLNTAQARGALILFAPKK